MAVKSYPLAQSKFLDDQINDTYLMLYHIFVSNVVSCYQFDLMHLIKISETWGGCHELDSIVVYTLV